MQTPYYVIHVDELNNNYLNLRSALDRYWKNNIIGYSYKTNSVPWIVSHFANLGAYAEVVSEDEYSLAKFIGVKNEKIIYNGSIKTQKSFVEALRNFSYVNIDSQRELEWLTELPLGEYNLGLRVNFDIERLCPNSSQCGTKGGRFGFCYENGELEKVIRFLQNRGVRIKGLHLHTSSKTRGVEIYKAIADTACIVADKYNLYLSFVDIGGGFFGGLPSKPQFDNYFQAVSEILRKKFNENNTTLIVEPGMAVIGSPVSYVTSVIDVKDTTYGRFVVTDGSRTNIDPLENKTSYFYEIVASNQKERLRRQVICGFTCMENDRLFEINNEYQLNVGDKIVYHKVGAYTMCLTPLFIKYFPDVYVEREGKYQKIRGAWSSVEYVQNSVWEQLK